MTFKLIPSPSFSWSHKVVPVAPVMSVEVPIADFSFAEEASLPWPSFMW